MAGRPLRRLRNPEVAFDFIRIVLPNKDVRYVRIVPRGTPGADVQTSKDFILSRFTGATSYYLTAAYGFAKEVSATHPEWEVGVETWQPTTVMRVFSGKG